MLSWTLAHGTENGTSGCKTPSRNLDGAPISAEALASYIGGGTLPQTHVTYAITTAIYLGSSGPVLYLTPGLGSATRTVFKKTSD